MTSVSGLPDDGWAIEERDSVRVVVLDPDDRVLLFRAIHPHRPDIGTWWELPGGGIDPGETVVDTAIRELREETGIAVAAEQLSRPTWSRIGTFQYHGVRRVQHEVVLVARLTATAVVDTSGQLVYEQEEYPEHRWWPADEIRASAARFYPGRLPEFLDALLRGETIDEGLEVWN